MLELSIHLCTRPLGASRDIVDLVGATVRVCLQLHLHSVPLQLTEKPDQKDQVSQQACAACVRDRQHHRLHHHCGIHSSTIVGVHREEMEKSGQALAQGCLANVRCMEAAEV